jgi:outer membrane receptor protein involved in Fe transport
MWRSLRPVLLSIFVCFALISPAAAGAQTGSTTATVNGTVTDESGAPIAGVNVDLRGATNKSTTTDAAGRFSISGLTAGFYVVAASKAGYSTAVQNDVALFSGQTVTLAIQMGAVTFSSLRTIASVRTGAHSINTTPASVNVVTTSTFIDQGQPQVTRVLSQIPGVQISFPSNSANAASPGSITVPNIRDATSYETASLIDGHPISVGQYGDNVTTFLNPFMFGSMEVIKGPGADAPEVNNAIGGTTNFRTKDPTLKPYSQMLLGVDNRGGTLSNFEYSNTIGKLGFVLDLATDNNPSPLSGKQVYYDPGQDAAFLPDGTPLADAGGYNLVGNTQSTLPTTPQLLACCWTLDGALDQTAELAKLQYHFSPVTRLTLSYLGSQTSADQNGNTGNYYQAVFSPQAGYSGSLPAGPIMYASIYPGAIQGEYNNEPIYQAELSTAVGNDSLAARYYNATISRYQYGGLSSSGYDWNNVTLYGTNSGGGQPTFNGTQQLVQYYDAYQEPELDKLQGESFEVQHPFGTGDLLTFSADWTASQSSDWYTYAVPPQYASTPGQCVVCYGWSIPPGTHSQLATYLLRGTFVVNPRLTATLSNYFNTYSVTYATNCPTDPMNNGGCSQASIVNGTGVTWATTNNAHYDPRLGITFRPNASSSIRFAMGSSIAPPYFGLLSAGGAAGTPVYDPSSQVALESVPNQNLKPETGFGYDLGADVRLPYNTTFSGDVYLTNLYNRFFNTTVATGLTCGQTNNCSTGASANTPIFNATNGNISNARFEGIELSLQRAPAVGFGFNIAGALERGYYYDLPGNFYCSFVPTPANPCIPSTYDQNVNIIAGQNTNGISVGYYGPPGGNYVGISYNGNMRIPYAQGNAELNYTFPNQVYFSLGETYYGKNNSLERPPFFIGYTTLRVPFSKSLAFQISGDNIFNAYPGILPVFGAGVPIDLANGGQAATNGNVLGPATWRFMITTRP